MSSNIPQARAILKDVIRSLGDGDVPREVVIEDLEGALALMSRTVKKRRAPVRSAVVDADMAHQIRMHAQQNPQASNQEIANVFGVNPGRVSEALHGLR